MQGRKPTGMDNGGESQLGGGVDQGRVREVDLVQETIDIRPGAPATNSPTYGQPTDRNFEQFFVP